MPSSVRVRTSTGLSKLPNSIGGRAGRIPPGNRPGMGINVFVPRRPRVGDLSTFFTTRTPLTQAEYDRLFDILENDAIHSEERGRAAIRLSVESSPEQILFNDLRNAIESVSQKLGLDKSSDSASQGSSNLAPFFFTVTIGLDPRRPFASPGIATKKGLHLLVAALYNVYGQVSRWTERGNLIRKYGLTHIQTQKLISG